MLAVSQEIRWGPGTFIASTPLGEYLGQNPYHKRLWKSKEDFKDWIEGSKLFKYTGKYFDQPSNWTGVFSKV